MIGHNGGSRWHMGAYIRREGKSDAFFWGGGLQVNEPYNWEGEGLISGRGGLRNGSLRYTDNESEKSIHLFPFFFFGYQGDCIDLDLGIGSGKIPDNSISASSGVSEAKNGRLNKIKAWCASTGEANPYLQIDLETIHIVCAVSTQGNPNADQWIETYTIQVSTDGTNWTDYKEHGQNKVRFCIPSTLSMPTVV